jgi:hypothetical protein
MIRFEIAAVLANSDRVERWRVADKFLPRKSECSRIQGGPRTVIRLPEARPEGLRAGFASDRIGFAGAHPW